MIIKKALIPKERNQAYEIRKNVFVEEQGVSIKEEIDQHEEEAIHFIGYLYDSPIAASRLRYIDDIGKLERLCILKEQRGKSFGRQMIAEMEQEIRKNNLSTAKLNAQTYAIPFYEQCGYTVISGEFMDAGIPHVTMIKQLI